jgi:ParB/RepB/Spo0J family partition protein
MKLQRVDFEQINIEIAPTNKRKQASMESLGQIQPVKLCMNGNGKYHILEGRRRIVDLAEMGFTDCWAIIEERLMTKEEWAWESLASNLGRTDNPMSQAEDIKYLKDTCNYTEKEIAKRCGTSQPNINKFYQFNKLIPDLQLRLKTDPGKFGVTAAWFASKLPPEDQQQLVSLETITIQAVKAMLAYYQSDSLDLSDLGIPDAPEAAPGLFLSGQQVQALEKGEAIEVVWNGKTLTIKTE